MAAGHGSTPPRSAASSGRRRGSGRLLRHARRPEQMRVQAISRRGRIGRGTEARSEKERPRPLHSRRRRCCSLPHNPHRAGLAALPCRCWRPLRCCCRHYRQQHPGRRAGKVATGRRRCGRAVEGQPPARALHALAPAPAQQRWRAVADGRAGALRGQEGSAQHAAQRSAATGERLFHLSRRQSHRNVVCKRCFSCMPQSCAQPPRRTSPPSCCLTLFPIRPTPPSNIPSQLLPHSFPYTQPHPAAASLLP